MKILEALQKIFNKKQENLEKKIIIQEPINLNEESVDPALSFRQMMREACESSSPSHISNEQYNANCDYYDNQAAQPYR